MEVTTKTLSKPALVYQVPATILVFVKLAGRRGGAGRDDARRMVKIHSPGEALTMEYFI